MRNIGISALVLGLCGCFGNGKLVVWGESRAGIIYGHTSSAWENYEGRHFMMLRNGGHLYIKDGEFNGFDDNTIKYVNVPEKDNVREISSKEINKLYEVLWNR
jgi:hypothetical protein